MKILLSKTNQTTKDNTGKTWDEWLDVLDKDNAVSMTHNNRVSNIHRKYNVDNWWAQNISVRYERARGLKQKFEKFDGTFETSKSKTFNIELTKLFQLIQTLIKNLSFGDIEITTLNKNKNIRGKMNNTTTFSFYFHSKGNKTQLMIQHFKLNNSEHCEQIREFWNKKLKEIEKEITI